MKPVLERKKYSVDVFMHMLGQKTLYEFLKLHRSWLEFGILKFWTKNVVYL